MHEQLIKVKLSTDVANLVNTIKKQESSKSLLFSDLKVTRERRDSMLRIYSLVCKRTRELYLDSLKKIEKNKERRLSQRLMDKMDKMEILQYWNLKNTGGDKSLLDQSFNCEKWVKITQQERQNMIYLNMFSLFKWFNLYREKQLWESFSNCPSAKDNFQINDDLAIASQRSINIKDNDIWLIAIDIKKLKVQLDNIQFQ